MKGTKGGPRKGMKIQNSNSVRASISFPSDIYTTLEELARQNKVSLAWVVRDAAERYIADRASKAKKPESVHLVGDRKIRTDLR
jgi:metal-responsive CopG/Arc/MetJ family transcriptional regulator